MWRILILGMVCMIGAAESRPPAKKATAAPPAARKATGKKAPAKKSPENTALATVLTIPKDAVEIEPGTFQHKDAAGKVWHYRNTPFGVRKFEPEQINTTMGANSDADLMTAVDLGDSIQFERKMPFGTSKWTRKKSELSEAEKITWERFMQAKQNKTAKGTQED